MCKISILALSLIVVSQLASLEINADQELGVESDNSLATASTNQRPRTTNLNRIDDHSNIDLSKLEMYRYGVAMPALVPNPHQSILYKHPANEFYRNQMERRNDLGYLGSSLSEDKDNSLSSSPLSKYLIASYQPYMSNGLMKKLHDALMASRSNLIRDQPALSASYDGPWRADSGDIVTNHREKKKSASCTPGRRGRACGDTFVRTMDYDMEGYWDAVGRR